MIRRLRYVLIFISALLVAWASALVRAQDLSWVEPAPGADLGRLQRDIKAQGGHVLTLAPEGRLLVRHAGRMKRAPTGVARIETMRPARKLPEPAGRGLGLRRISPEKLALPGIAPSPVSAVEPNRLSAERAMLQSLQSLPSMVDNSLSIYFPPISSQGSQSSCVGWAAGYYWNTYTQARDEGLDASSGSAELICSPAFVYNLINDGVDDGAGMESALWRINTSGACSLALMPYNVADWVSWPDEAGWIEAMRRRTKAACAIGSWYGGCTDDDLLAIKQLLANGDIAITSTDVYYDWYHYYPNGAGVNNGVLFANSGANIGGHALTIVGYDDNRPYDDGSTTRYGAFLIANSWGSDWGVYNSAGTSKGFMWVGYDFFKSTSYCFGIAYYNTDRDHYRTRLYAATGLNHVERGNLLLRGGVGLPATPTWRSDYVLDYAGGEAHAISDNRRVVIDFDDAIDFINLPGVSLYAQLYVSSYASVGGTVSSATFFHDFDGNGVFESVVSPDPTLTAAPGSTVNAAAQFTWNDGLIHSLAFSPIASPQTAWQPIPVTISARDLLGQTAAGFTGSAALTGCVESTTTVGIGTESWNAPLGAYYEDSRAQCIYTHGELGTPTTWTAIQLNVAAVPGQKLENFTIRMKHTGLAAYGSEPQWESSGWTTVYRHDKAFVATGPVRLDFDAPFVYDGASNLMIDLSFNNDDWSSDGGLLCASASDRAIHAQSDSEDGDPLDWNGASPEPEISSLVPAILLISGRTIPVTPASTSPFTAGVWSGTVTMPCEAGGVFLVAQDGAGHSGRSNWFNVLPGLPTGSLTVNITPAEATANGAMWRRMNTTVWRAGGQTESGITAGNYTVEFLDAAGFIAPSLQPVAITAGQTTTLNVTYTQMTDVWLDFDYIDDSLGTEFQPFKTLADSVAAVAVGGTIHIKPASNAQTIRITKPLRLQAEGGTVTLGRN